MKKLIKERADLHRLAVASISGILISVSFFTDVDIPKHLQKISGIALAVNSLYGIWVKSPDDKNAVNEGLEGQET